MKRGSLVRSVSSLGLASALLVPAASGSGGVARAAVPAHLRESVAYLTSTYRITPADALRRLRLQADKGRLVGRLHAALRHEFAGAWLDQRRGGVLNVATTRPAHARQVMRRLPHRAEMRVLPATYSLDDLSRIQNRVASRTEGTGYAQVNMVQNRVDVWTDKRGRVRHAISTLGTDRRAVAVRTMPHETPTACKVDDCDPPMRAGITIQLAKANLKTLDYCTSGFNIADQTGALYTSTAGHCFTELEKKKKKPATITSYEKNVLIASRDGAGTAIESHVNPRLDYAFVRVTDPAKWYPAGKPRNIDYFHCSPEPQPKACAKDAQTHRFRITGVKAYADMRVGDTVCMSGASPQPKSVAPGTRCGEITELPAEGIRTNICAKVGDSGSPLFDQATGMAYGIESSVESDERGPCGPADKQKTNYTALSSALAAAGVLNRGRTYHLITQ